jgi:hypothetical protein
MKTRRIRPVLILVLLLSLFYKSVDAQIFDGDVWVNGSNGSILRVVDILNNPFERLVCTTSSQMADIGFSPNGKLYSVRLGSHDMRLIDTITGNDSIVFLLPVPFPNALSFDEKGIAYIGSSSVSSVGWVDLTKTPSTGGIWHDFGQGNASGDFIFMLGKLYIAWRTEFNGILSDFLYEVTIDTNNNYISHRNLGKLPPNTYGMSSDAETQLFCVTSSNDIYSIIPPSSPVQVVPTSLLYTCTMAGFSYGATSKAESLGNTFFDYGDAPYPFPTFDSLSGAIHKINPLICLGNLVDPDLDGQPEQDATGDDNDEDGNDDDGIFIGDSGIQNAVFVSDSTIQLEVICKGTGYLNAWIDWNMDGDWSDYEEHLISNTSLSDGVHVLSLNIPQLLMDGRSFCRFRFSTVSNLTYESFAPDGEVEDYLVNLKKCTLNASVNLDSLELFPTTCGGNNGAIVGIKVTGTQPFTYEWQNQAGEIVGSTLDLYHLGIGYYELKITDSFGCSDSFSAFEISDAGNIWIDTATVTPAYCGNTDGTLTITAISGLGSMLQYFIKTGSDTLSKWGDGNFAGLAGGIYYVWVSDSVGCSRPYAHVLQIDALTAPEILTATSTPETGSAANGTITVNALGIGLTYSLNGATPASTGHFTGLSAGDYSVTVTNPAGCDTTFTVTVAHKTGIVLSAIAGNGFACLGKEAKAPIVVRNFKDVQSFETILNYDPLFVTCLGYNNPNPLLGGSFEVTLPASGKILTRWSGTSPITLPDSAEMMNLIFNSKLPGNALLLWDESPELSNFFGPGGDTLNVDYTLGTILVSNPPQILPAPEQKVCEGELLWVSATVLNGTGQLSYLWQTPTGPNTQESIFSLATMADNGLYSLIVTDTLQCADTLSQLVTVVPTRFRLPH